MPCVFCDKPCVFSGMRKEVCFEGFCDRAQSMNFVKESDACRFSQQLMLLRRKCEIISTFAFA